MFTRHECYLLFVFVNSHCCGFVIRSTLSNCKKHLWVVVHPCNVTVWEHRCRLSWLNSIELLGLTGFIKDEKRPIYHHPAPNSIAETQASLGRTNYPQFFPLALLTNQSIKSWPRRLITYNNSGHHKKRIKMKEGPRMGKRSPLIISELGSRMDHRSVLPLNHRDNLPLIFALKLPRPTIGRKMGSVT